MPDFSFMWWRRNLFLLSGKHEYTGMLLTTNNVKWWCMQCFKKLFESCKVHLLLKFSTFQYSKIPLYWSLHSSWCCNQLALANEIWCQRLPREITNASLLFVLCRAQKREGKFSTIVCGSVHVAQKTLVVWYKKFSNLVWSKKFFFTSTSWFSICFHISLRNLCWDLSISAVVNQLMRKQEATSGNYRLSTKHHV